MSTRSPYQATTEANQNALQEIVGKLESIRASIRLVQSTSRVLLNPSAMARSKITPGSFVGVISKDKELILAGIAWPLDKLKKNNIGVLPLWEKHVSIWMEKDEEVIVKPLLSPLEHFKKVNASYLKLQVLSRGAKAITIGSKPKNKNKILSLNEKKLLNQYIQVMLQDTLVHYHAILSLPVHGVTTTFQIENIQTSTEPEPLLSSPKPIVIYRVCTDTNLEIQWEEKTSDKPEQRAEDPDSDKMKEGFHMVGGLKKEVKMIRQMIEQPLKNPQLFEKYNLPPPKGLLMFGPPGTGKTLIARALASTLDAKIFFINGPEIVSKFVGESEANLREIFQKAAASAPSLVFIDEIDAICPKRDDRGVGDMEKRMVATLLTLMDGMEKKAKVVVLAATNRPNALDPAIRRPGRFDREVEISIPNIFDRYEILEVCLKKIPHDVPKDELNKLSSLAHGYVGADLSALIKEASLLALKRYRNKIDATFCIHLEDLKRAMAGIKPSGLREVAIDVPQVYWKDIGGQDDIKQQLKEAVEWPLKHPEAFVRMGIRPPKGVLLYGPPGCSKTLTAKALATESSMNFIAVKGPELYSKWVGESEKAIQSIFRKARAAAPTIIFFDEIDAIATQRGGDGNSQVADRVLTQLLTELDGIEPLKQVLVVAATNRPDLIDHALMRPGRFDRVLYVAPPDEKARLSILKIHTRKMPLDEEMDLQVLAKKTKRFSGAELYALCREAAMCAIEQDKNVLALKMEHFEKALGLVRPQINDQMLQFFQNFRNKKH
jgi:AAA family ATPase